MKNSLRTVTFGFFILFFAQTIVAQTAAIRGFVYEKQNGEPAIYANVQLKGTSYGSSTDVNGYFIITKVPEGHYTLIVTYLGFDSDSIDVQLKKNQIINKKLYLKKSSVNLQTVTVNAEYARRRTETNTSVIRITPKAINKIPSIGGQADIAQYLQVVPGVVFTGDQGGQFYIRGGSPIQNKVILDGMTIYNPFHSIGLFSVFETDLIRSANIYTGGFNAEYGGRISSIMDITYRDGNKKRYAGSLGAGTFGGHLMLEGPIVKQKSPESGSASFVLSLKHSYLSESSKMFYKYIDKNGLPFNFTDVYGKITLSAPNGSKVSVFGFNFNDNVKSYKSIADYGWKSSGGGVNFVIIPGNSPVLVEGVFAYSQYNSGINSVAMKNRSSFIGGFNGAINFTYFMGKNTLKYGLEVEGYRTEYHFTNFIDAKIEQIENTTQLGAYAEYKAILGKFIIEPGFRLQWYASLANVSPEPRLSVKYNITNHFRMKFAGGFYSQNLIAATSDRDVVNLFYGFLSGPENLPSTFNGKPITHKLQKAQHAIVGGEFDLSKNVFLNIEAYYKNFSQLTNINRFKIYNEGSAPEGAPDRQVKDFIIEQGNAYGLDVVLKYDYNKFYAWMVYSLGYVHREYENEQGKLSTYTPHFDRRHNVNVVLSYITGPKKQWEFNLRWNFGTGFPFTQVQGFYEHLTLPGGVNTKYSTENGKLGVLYADLYKGRLPTYHRLDVDAKRNFYFSEKTKLVLDFSIINVYNRKNIFYVDLVTGKVVYQLPFMPSLSLNLYF